MGLLDAFYDPNSAGLLAIGTGLLGASGPSRMPIGLGQALGGAMNQGMAAYQNVKEIADRDRMQSLQAQAMQESLNQARAMHPLQVQQLQSAIAQQDLQRKVAAQFPQLIESLRGGGSPAAATPYQDQVTPQQVGSTAPPTVQFNGSPESYFKLASGIQDPTEKRAAIEAGMRQWPQFRPMVQQAPPGGATDRDPATALGAYAAMIGTAGLKGSDEVMKFASMMQPRELKEGSTYQNPLTGAREFMPKMDVGMRPGQNGGIEAMPGMMDFLRNKAQATVDPVAAGRLRYETGVDVGQGSSAGVGGVGAGVGGGQSPVSLPPAAQNAIRQKEAESIATKSGDILDSSKAAAAGAVERMNSINQIRGALGNAYVGPFANQRMTMAQLSELINPAGADSNEKLQNTRALINGLAKMALDSASQLKGQGQISNEERALLMKASSGSNDTMTVPELKMLADISERVATRQYQSHQGLLGRAKNQNINTWAYEVPPMPATPLPKNAKASDLVKGKTYSTPKGDLVWNGMMFEDK